MKLATRSQMRALCDHARAGRVKEAEEVHRRLLPLFKALFVESNPGPVKSLLATMGLIENELRLPLVPVEPATVRVLAEAAAAAGIRTTPPVATAGRARSSA